jgi:hypothetical protein
MMVRVVLTLLAVCLPVLIHGSPVVTQFVASGHQAYLEIALDDGRVQQIYTESRGDYKALMVFGEKSNPELLKYAFSDASKKIVTSVYELRTDKDVPSPGRDVATNEFIKSLKSDEKGFADWQARFASFPEEPTSQKYAADPGFADPIDTVIVDGGGGIVFRIKDWLCHCREGRISSLCIISATRCALDNLCTVWDCVEAEYWTPECYTARDQAEACLGELEQ